MQSSSRVHSDSLDKLTHEILVLGNLCGSFFEKGSEAGVYMERLNQKLLILEGLPAKSVAAVLKKVATVEKIEAIFKKYEKETTFYSSLLERLRQSFTAFSRLSLSEEINKALVSCTNAMEKNAETTECFGQLEKMIQILKNNLAAIDSLDGEELREIAGSFSAYASALMFSCAKKEKFDIATAVARHAISILQRLRMLIKRGNKDLALEQLILNQFCNFNILLSKAVFSIAAIHHAEANLAEAEVAMRDARDAYLTLKKMPKMADGQFFKMLQEIFTAHEAPFFAKIAALKGQVQKAKESVALGIKYYHSLTGVKAKITALVNLNEACLYIADHYYGEKNIFSALEWYEYALDLAREEETYIKDNPRHASFEGFNFLAKAKEKVERGILKVDSVKSSLMLINFAAMQEIISADKRVITDLTMPNDYDSVMSFANLRYAKEIKKMLKHHGIYFSPVTELSIKIYLCSANPKEFMDVLEKCIERCKKVGESDAPTVIGSTVEVSSSSAFTEERLFLDKKEKLARHAEKELERQKQASQEKELALTDVRELEHNNAASKAKEKIVWKDGVTYSTNPDDYFRLYGNERIVTFAKFSKRVFDEVDPVVAKKFMTVIPRGNVIASDNTQGNQGSCFNLTREESAKHNPPYVCKGKVLGGQGVGDCRIFGYKSATGTFFSSKPGQEKMEKRPCERIKFDWVNTHSHTRS